MTPQLITLTLNSSANVIALGTSFHIVTFLDEVPVHEHSGTFNHPVIDTIHLNPPSLQNMNYRVLVELITTPNLIASMNAIWVPNPPRSEWVPGSFNVNTQPSDFSITSIFSPTALTLTFGPLSPTTATSCGCLRKRRR